MKKSDKAAEISTWCRKFCPPIMYKYSNLFCIGFDWKPYLSIGSFGETIRKFSYVAINQANQDVTLSEVSGTTSKSVILKSGILQVSEQNSNLDGTLWAGGARVILVALVMLCIWRPLPKLRI